MPWRQQLAINGERPGLASRSTVTNPTQITFARTFHGIRPMLRLEACPFIACLFFLWLLTSYAFYLFPEVCSWRLVGGGGWKRSSLDGSSCTVCTAPICKSVRTILIVPVAKGLQSALLVFTPRYEGGEAAAAVQQRTRARSNVGLEFLARLRVCRKGIKGLQVQPSGQLQRATSMLCVRL